MLVAQYDQRLGRGIVADKRASPSGQDCPNAIGQCPLFVRQCAKGGDVCKLPPHGFGSGWLLPGHRINSGKRSRMVPRRRQPDRPIAQREIAMNLGPFAGITGGAA